MKHLRRFVSRFSKLRILVVGDVMLDRFVVGDVTRINPEAPVPVLAVRREYEVPGGAANAAANAASLGARVAVVGYVGQDAEGARLGKLLRARRIAAELVAAQRPTVAKIRAIARGQQLLRLDYENDKAPPRRVGDALLDRVRGLLPRIDAVLVSDYGKGVVTDRLMACLTGGSGAPPVVTVDPKPEHVALYRDVTLLTPNTKEAGACAHVPVRTDRDVARVGRQLSRDLNAHVLITRGERGMSLYAREGETFDLPTVAKEVIDVTGAGDTVIAAVTLGLAARVPLRDAVRLANVAAGIVVSKVGTAAVTAAELRAALG